MNFVGKIVIYTWSIFVSNHAIFNILHSWLNRIALECPVERGISARTNPTLLESFQLNCWHRFKFLKNELCWKYCESYFLCFSWYFLAEFHYVVADSVESLFNDQRNGPSSWGHLKWNSSQLMASFQKSKKWTLLKKWLAWQMYHENIDLKWWWNGFGW